MTTQPLKKHLEVAIKDLTEYNELVLCIGLLKSQLNRIEEKKTEKVKI